MTRFIRVAASAALATGLVAAGAWAFLAYTRPDRVLDFAALLQMCGFSLR